MPETDQDALREHTVAELREEAKEAGVKAPSTLRKEELVQEISKAQGSKAQGSTGGGAGESDDSAAGGAGPDGGHLRTGSGTSDSLKYSQEVTSPDDEPERPGRSLATTDHDVIRQWAEERGGVPATVDGTEHGDHLGVLRFAFGGDDDRLREVSWEEWFRTFDDRRLNFLYQEEKKDGSPSMFFRLESPDREDG